MKYVPRLVNLFLRLQFSPVSLTLFASFLSFSLIHSTCLLFLLIHTFCFSHSCHTLSLSLPIMFSSYCSFLSVFLLFLHMPGSPPFSPRPLSRPLMFISVLVSHTCCDDTFDPTLLGLSDWYAGYSHTWCGTEVPAELELQLLMLCLCACDNYHGCQ